ncbi:MAG: hypothetical protein ABSG59_07890 [Verrucomicrobiota bacterium]|jgi:REP element-mobilizing transposase RayT
MAPETRRALSDAYDLSSDRPGDRRQPVFLEDADRRVFLYTVAEACAMTDWQIHAYCVMRNDFHLVVETPFYDA